MPQTVTCMRLGSGRVEKEIPMTILLKLPGGMMTAHCGKPAHEALAQSAPWPSLRFLTKFVVRCSLLVVVVSDHILSSSLVTGSHWHYSWLLTWGVAIYRKCQLQICSDQNSSGMFSFDLAGCSRVPENMSAMTIRGDPLPGISTLNQALFPCPSIPERYCGWDVQPSQYQHAWIMSIPTDINISSCLSINPLNISKYRLKAPRKMISAFIGTKYTVISFQNHCWD